MRKFSFALERVLSIRELKKAIAVEQLGAELRKKHALEKSLAEALAAQAHNRSSIKSNIEGSLNQALLKDHLSYARAVDKDVIERKEGLDTQNLAVSKAQEELIERNREQKALELLREKRFFEHRDKYWWEQNKQLDEIAAHHYNRNRKEVV